ncbi:DNA repair exonuclease [Aromatoleum aromaticum EbN1]|uniref:DNA repair exonuclease n=1 Tax=Aromatoleum aromaticum (strain DSM 19018 / LMG 30748 / EbN1) TaxID=76114 RepID=Q5P8D3_AROAE|nr:metallophosphoesterase [Aromatoleum aromaticum]CAI06426.1 DNA repair exonuclease [Aromatoleum aromaticum EbN1]
MRLAHISDPHFGTEEAPVRDALREDLLREAPDLVVLTGDITQRARQAQFRAARAFLDSLAPLPVLTLPGNHDLPLFDLFTRFTAPYRHYRRHICASLSPLWRGRRVAVVGVNSTRMLRHKHGELPAPLVEQVARQLAALGESFKVVALHHPLEIIEPSDRRNRVRGADAALAAWIAAGADLFLGGHIHLPYCVATGDGSRDALVLQAGTSMSTRRRNGRPNSYNLVRFVPIALRGAGEAGLRRIEIEERDHDARIGRFTIVTCREAVCTGSGWSLLSQGAVPLPG